MSTSLKALAQRRERLVARCEEDRRALAGQVECLRAPLGWADRGVAALRYARRHPALLLAVGVALAVWRPRSAGRWLGRAWVAWQMSRKWLV